MSKPETENHCHELLPLMLNRYRKWRTGFYAGPVQLGLRIPRRKHYQSPTLTLGYWAYALIVSHLTAAGQMLLLTGVVLVPYTMSTMLMPIHLLGFALPVLFGIDLAVGYLLCPKVQVRRQLPARISAGAEVPVCYELSNTRNRTLWDLRIDTLPMPATVRFVQGRAFLPVVSGGSRHKVQVLLSARRRGSYTLPAVRADSSFPFHLWRWGSTCGTAERLIVFPEFTQLSRFDVDGGRRYQLGGIALSSKTGESMEFLGCREYRNGDNPRQIHWRSWARTGFPVVREFAEEYLCRSAIVLDTLCPRMWNRLPWEHHDAPKFEAAVSLTAAIAEYLARQEYIVDLFAAGPEVYRFRSGRSLAYLQDMLDILACLEPTYHEPFTQLEPSLIAEISQISSVTFLLLNWNEPRQRFIEKVIANGVCVRCYLLQAQPAATAPPAYVRLLDAEHILAGRCRELS